MAKTKHTAIGAEEELERGVARLRHLHKMGKTLLEKYPGVSSEASKGLDEFAEKKRMSRPIPRTLKNFADKNRGYTDDDLERLIKRCRESRRALGTSFLTSLLSVRDRNMREELERLTLEERWSHARLNQEIAARMGERRKHGGRRPRIPKDRPGLLAQLDGYVERWVRWEKVANKQGILKDKEHILPAKIKTSLRLILAEIASLRESLNKARKRKASLPSRKTSGRPATRVSKSRS